MKLLQTELGFTEAEAQSEVTTQWGGYISSVVYVFDNPTNRS